MTHFHLMISDIIISYIMLGMYGSVIYAVSYTFLFCPMIGWPSTTILVVSTSSPWNMTNLWYLQPPPALHHALVVGTSLPWVWSVFLGYGFCLHSVFLSSKPFLLAQLSIFHPLPLSRWVSLLSRLWHSPIRPYSSSLSFFPSFYHLVE
jgi:hypothetical protein